MQSNEEVEEGAEGYTQGIAYVLGNDENWALQSKEAQIKLRGQRARAGVTCDGCGAVGHFRRTCPKCGPQVLREVNARKRPTVLPAFKQAYSREFGVWASRILVQLCPIKEATGERSSRVALIRLRRFLDGDEKCGDSMYNEKFSDWLATTPRWRQVLDQSTNHTGGGGGAASSPTSTGRSEVQPDSSAASAAHGAHVFSGDAAELWRGKLRAAELEEALHDYHRWWHQVDNLAQRAGMGLKRETKSKNFFWGAASVAAAAADSASSSAPQRKNGVAPPALPQPLPLSPPTQPKPKPAKSREKFGSLVGGKDDYFSDTDEVRGMTVGEAVQHYRSPPSVAAPSSSSSSSSSQNKGANFGDTRQGEQAQATAGLKNSRANLTNESERLAPGRHSEAALARHHQGHQMVEFTTHWQDGTLRSFPHGSSGHQGRLPSAAGGEPGATELMYGSDPNRLLDDGSELVARAVVSTRALESLTRLPFVARDGVEENFQAVLRRLATVTRTEMGKVLPEFAKSVFRPPRGTVHARFFPEAVWEEHREYLEGQLGDDYENKAHTFNGSLRKPDDVVYFGDRSSFLHGQHAQQQRRGQVASMFEPSKGGRQQKDSGWQGSTSPTQPQHPSLAGAGASALGPSGSASAAKAASVYGGGSNGGSSVGGKAGAEVSRKLKQGFREQGRWVGAQNALAIQRRKRCEHLLVILNEEMLKDAKRESGLLENKLSPGEKRKRLTDMAKARAEAADRVMRILQEYGILSGDEMADYYTYTMNFVESLTQVPSEGRGKGPHRASNNTTNNNSKRGDGKDLQQLKKVALYTPSSESYQPRPKFVDNATSFQKAGLAQTFRTGQITEHSTTPAVVCLPQAVNIRGGADGKKLTWETLGTSQAIEGALLTSEHAAAKKEPTSAKSGAGNDDDEDDDDDDDDDSEFGSSSRRRASGGGRAGCGGGKKGKKGRGFHSLGLVQQHVQEQQSQQQRRQRQPTAIARHNLTKIGGGAAAARGGPGGGGKGGAVRRSGVGGGGGGGNGPGGPVEDKYSMGALAGRFPTEEPSSYAAAHTMETFRRAQPVDPRSGRVVSTDIYMPDRVSEAPPNPPGSRIFSAAIGRSMGKFLPDKESNQDSGGNLTFTQKAAKFAQQAQAEAEEATRLLQRFEPNSKEHGSGAGGGKRRFYTPKPGTGVGGLGGEGQKTSLASAVLVHATASSNSFRVNGGGGVRSNPAVGAESATLRLGKSQASRGHLGAARS